MQRIGFAGPAFRAAFVLVVGAVVTGALALAPAGAAKKGLTIKKGDARYVNVGEKAADADMLDGRDSSEFLGATGKAADADKLDGQDSGAFVMNGDTIAGRFSCPGGTFFPTASGIGYGIGTNGQRTSSAAQTFRCDATLPHGATITEFTATLHDNSTSDPSCSLRRTDQAPPTAAEDSMAFVQTIGTPGDSRLSNTTINQALVDDESYGYSIECFLPGGTGTEDILGATVGYEVAVA